MSVKDDLQAALKDAMKNKDSLRLECLRMAKAALLLKEKAKPKGEGLTDEESLAAIRSEAKKRSQSAETFRELGKEEEAAKLDQEIAVLEEFLPKQLDADAIEARVRAFLADHPEVNHAGKLTGMMKKELGEQADGRVLNEVCRKVLE